MEKELEEALRSLDPEEQRVLRYFYNNVSVGEIIALRELRTRYKIRDPEDIIRRLIDKGLLERGEGCYNLARRLREAKYRETAPPERRWI